MLPITTEQHRTFVVGDLWFWDVRKKPSGQWIPTPRKILHHSASFCIMSFTNGEEAFKGVGAPSLKSEVSGEWHYRA